MPSSEIATGGAGAARPSHPGAFWDGHGVRFTVWSRHATAVEVCLFSGARGEVEQERVALGRGDGHLWRGYVAGLGPGAFYGLRVNGPWEPSRGHLFNRAKLLVDPYALAVSGGLRPHAALHGHRPDRKRLLPSAEDSAPWVPRSVVVDPAFDWQGDRPPDTPWAETVIYECHVKGLTWRHPEVPPELRGTYLGLAHPAVIEHLRGLGVTAVELLPVLQFVSRPEIVERGLVNYWGYDPIAWLAPHGGYASDDRGAQVAEFKAMVRALHAAGLEVILDVVLNHSAEGHERELTLSLRGLDHAAYYRLRPGRAPLQEDFTGCGNTVDTGGEAGRALALASLRYWVEEMHVDGFRFDLAATLGRSGGGFDPAAELLAAIAADPALAGVKLIAEPWDLGPDGFALGRFPDGWAEWNARYRDTVRSFWRGDPGALPDLATRLAGSSDLFAGRDLGAAASVNFVTCHDGFTLRDLVSYERKHNLANGEENRDGSDHNVSSNQGVEGPTGDPAIRARRRRLQRCLLATLGLSAGTPMLAQGDELGRTQRGNNNAYCQDNEISWVDWELDDERSSLVAFTRALFALRRRLPALGARRGAGADGPGAGPELTWLLPDGSEPRRAADWEKVAGSALGMRVEPGGGGAPLLVLLNAAAAEVDFRLPAAPGASWRQLFHTDGVAPVGLRRGAGGAGMARLPGLAVVVLAAGPA